MRMGHVAVQPVRSHHGPGKRVEVLAAEAVLPASSSYSTATIYIIQPVGKLPTIDVTKSLASVLVGRKHADLANKWAVRLASRHHGLLYVMGFLYIVALSLLFVIEDNATRLVVSIVSVLLLTPVLAIHSGALCWDMLMLLMATFEFWFLIFINTVSTVVWGIMFADIRGFSAIVGGVGCLLTVFLDANHFMRVLVLRLFVPGAVGMLFLVIAANVNIGSDIHYSVLDVWGAKMKDVDVINSCMSTIAFFMVTRAFRYRHDILTCHRDDKVQSDVPFDMIQCDIYFPVCRLVLYEEWNRQRRTSVSYSPRMFQRLAQKTQLELVERDQLRIIDARNTVVSLKWFQLGANGSTCRFHRILPWILNAIGIGGCIGAIFLSCLEVVNAQNPTHGTTGTSAQWHITVTVCTAVFVLIQAAYFQRELVRRIFVEIDAWFVAFQALVVALGVCDVFLWDKRSFLVATAWIWCHWMIFLDALPPVMRKRLGLSRVFIVFVSIAGLVFPVWLGYMVVYAPNWAENRNRTIFEAQMGRVDVRMEMLSFLLSRIFTLWVWMGRFFWREVLRPRDSFKLIKYRVHFPFGR